MDVTIVWTIVIAVGVAMYIVLDGFDLGIGILFPFARREDWRDTMMMSVAPVWDGNETWLILGGASLFAAFPKAYALALEALYIPLVIFLIALVFRGVAFEFRFKSDTSRWAWNLSFAAGSTVAAFAQGVVLGSFVQGLDFEAGRYAGGPGAWLTPFSVVTGLGLVAGYGLLGATWLIRKTEGALQQWAYRAATPLAVAILAFIILISVWTPLSEPDIAARWFSVPNILFLSPVPIVTALLGLGLLISLNRRMEGPPFPAAIGLFLVSYVGLAISLWPYIIPRALTIWEAAAPRETQVFMLVGVLIFLPVILAYTIYVYRVFRGKVRPGEAHY